MDEVLKAVAEKTG